MGGMGCGPCRSLKTHREVHIFVVEIDLLRLVHALCGKSIDLPGLWSFFHFLLVLS